MLIKNGLLSIGKAEDKCENAVYYEDIEDVATTSVGGTALDAEDVAHPCGLQAKSYAEGNFRVDLAF